MADHINLNGSNFIAPTARDWDGTASTGAGTPEMNAQNFSLLMQDLLTSSMFAQAEAADRDTQQKGAMLVKGSLDKLNQG